mmetsp:Transcript_22931/g.54091  ORF Transcript_22931/g.54091 Transcript_22931/m.54091 type:complete len:529 (+) Transcript_22931:38-1624(+)
MESDSTLYSRNVSPVSVALRGNGGGVFSPPPGFPGFASKCHAWARRGYGSHTFGLGPRQTPEASHAGVEEMQLDEGDGEGRKGGGEFASVVNVGISVHHQGRPQATCVGAFSHQCSSESWPSRPGGGKQNGIQIAGNVIQVHPHLQPQLPSPSPAVVGSFGGVVAPSAPEIMAANGQTGWLTEFQHQQETLALANGGNVGGIARQHPGNSRQHQADLRRVSPGPLSYYKPPTPCSFASVRGALVQCGQWSCPLDTVQDRPLVQPIYNGVNPDYPGLQLIHAHPPIYVVDQFLDHAECDFLIESARSSFCPAPVVGEGEGVISPARTSSTCYMAREDLPEYMRKISLLTGKIPEHCELPQVGQYLPSQQYMSHLDAFDVSGDHGRRFAGNGGQRSITVLTYLNDVSKGGATAFPRLNVEVRPRKGMALVFFPATVDGHVDGNALHEACPAVDVKYVSQVWIRQGVYEGSPHKRLAQKMVPGLQAARDELLRREARWDELASARRQAEHNRMNPQVFAPPSFVQATHAGC